MILFRFNRADKSPVKSEIEKGLDGGLTATSNT